MKKAGNLLETILDLGEELLKAGATEDPAADAAGSFIIHIFQGFP